MENEKQRVETSRAWWMVGAVALTWSSVACTETQDGAPRATPTTYEPDLPSGGEPSRLSLEDAAQLVDEVTLLLSAYQPGRARAIYDELFLLGDSVCPAAQPYTGEDGEQALYWEAYCQSNAGTYFSGSMQASSFDEAPNFFFVLSSDGPFSIVASSGRFIRGTTYVEAGHFDDEHYVYASGVFEADPDSAAHDPWLSGAVRGEIDMSVDGTAAARTAHVNATLALRDNERAAAVEVREWASDAAGCALGEIAMRSKDGGWQKAVFGANGSCSTCAELHGGDEALGEFCVAETSLQRLAAWEVEP